MRYERLPGAILYPQDSQAATKCFLEITLFGGESRLIYRIGLALQLAPEYLAFSNDILSSLSTVYSFFFPFYSTSVLLVLG